jgi:hypothetical protein
MIDIRLIGEQPGRHRRNSREFLRDTENKIVSIQ